MLYKTRSGEYESIIGVHFWERQIRLSICDDESVSTAALDLPSDIKRLNIIANDFALKKALEVIDECIGKIYKKIVEKFAFYHFASLWRGQAPWRASPRDFPFRKCCRGVS